MDWQAMVREFHEATATPVEPEPCIPKPPRQGLRIELISEEIGETLEAMVDGDLVEIADGIGDSIYVLLGAALEYGIDMGPIMEEIHRTNMAKASGPVREDGKRMKPAGWQPPDIARLLREQQS